MSKLRDLDRPIITWHYDKWKCDLLLQALSGSQFAKIKDDLAADEGDETQKEMRLCAAICACGVKEPQYTEDEWLDDASPLTLTDISTKITNLSRLDADEAKKN